MYAAACTVVQRSLCFSLFVVVCVFVCVSVSV